MLLKNNNKYYINIIKSKNNLIQRKIVKMTFNLRWMKYYNCFSSFKLIFGYTKQSIF